MKKIIKNVAPYWYFIVVILLLLGVQAYCDLSLPQYTSNIIDVGIVNQGVEYALPEKITKEDFYLSEFFMNKEEKQIWENAYQEDNGNKALILEDKQLEEAHQKLLIPLILAYQMENISEAQFRVQIKGMLEKNEQTKTMASSLDSMTLEEIGKALNLDLSTFEAEDDDGNLVTYVDMRPLLQTLVKSGAMTTQSVDALRKTMEETISTIGDHTLSSMAIAYAASCAKRAGIDLEDVQISYMKNIGIKMFTMAFLMLVAAVIVGFLAAKVGAGVGRDLRGKIFKKVVSFSNAEIDQFSTASLITRSTNDVQQIQMVTALMLRMILYAPILGIGGVYKVYHTGADMGWIIGLAVLIILGFVGILMGLAMPKFKIMQKLVDHLNLVSREILTGLSVIRAFGREKTEEERFDQANTNLMKTQLFTNRVMTFMMPGMMMVLYGITILIVWVSAHQIDAGSLQVGAMTAFITYTMQIVMSFLMLTMMSIMLPRAGVAAERIDEVLQTPTSIEESKEPKKLKVHSGKLEFNQVSFSYPESKEKVLENISFSTTPGEITAIIGSTGCGKSTLVNLIPRFYDVTKGKITLDGEDIRNISLKELREEIGFVPQKGVLFSGTITSNLKFGKEEASEEELKEAAKIAQATEFIETKHLKYESTIAQGGSNVSGGQKQRLSIARAIVKQPKLFVFDDSFSALDMKTDAALRKALESKIKTCSVIIVAQRISTILNADQILVLEEGRLVGKGRHEELLKHCEVYQQIAKSQLSAKELGLEEMEVFA